MSCTVPTQAEVTAVIKRMRQQGTDDGLCEAKSCEHELGRSVWASVSAFANTNGGLLLLGIDENAGFTVPEGFDANKVIAQFIDGICYVTGRGLPTGAYHRVDDHDITMSTTDVFEIINLMTPSASEREEIEDSSMANLDGELVRAFLERNKGGRLKGISTVDEQLHWLGVTSNSGKLCLCGLMALGQFPQQFLPTCSIDVIAWPGTAFDIEANLRYIDRLICEGPLPVMVCDAVAFVMRNLRCCGVVQGAGRIDIPEIPRDAIREAIANAVIHREYSPQFRGGPVRVNIYYDYVEVINPGGLWGGKNLLNISDGNSRCRNPTLMRMMRDVPLSSEIGTGVEGIGRGVSTMTKKMRDQGLPAPSFKVTPDQVTVRLFSPSIWPADVDLWGNVNFPENPPIKIHEIRIS